MTQKERVLLYLQTMPEGVCVECVPRDLGYTLRNRIGELRRENVPIEGSRCIRHPHKAPVFSYRLVPAEQLALL